MSLLSRSFQQLGEACPEESLRTTVLTQMASLPECPDLIAQRQCPAPNTWLLDLPAQVRVSRYAHTLKRGREAAELQAMGVCASYIPATRDMRVG